MPSYFLIGLNISHKLPQNKTLDTGKTDKLNVCRLTYTYITYGNHCYRQYLHICVSFLETITYC